MYSRETVVALGWVESISALSEAMPWNALARVIIKWLETRADREIQVSIDTESGMQVFYAKGHSIKQIEKILPNAVNIDVIQTKPDQKT